MVFSRGGDVPAAFQEWQSAAANEVDLETEQDVVGPRGGHERLGIGADTEQPADKAADVRGHGHHQVSPRDGAERVGH